MKIIPEPQSIISDSPETFSYTPDDAVAMFDASIPQEGYKLVSSRDGLRIHCSTEAGFFYGKVTAEWLSPDGYMPSVTVSDYPRFGYRGFMIDCARHFFTVEELLKRIEVASRFKLNVFHWHLTDDQGWRAEIRRYPRLTEIGSYRTGTKGDGKPVKGFYTQEDMRRVVEFAAERHISVLPEIDLPGHMSAAIAAYPQLGCSGKEIAVKETFGIHEEVLCAGSELTYEFIFNVLDELVEIFPFEYFHIGGDEALRLNWLDCDKCRRKIEEEGLKNEDELQAYMMNVVAEHLARRGKTAVAWNDGMNADNISPGIVMQYWKDDKKSLKRAAAHMNVGTKAVMSPFFAYYLEYPYGMTSLKKCFSRDPVPKGAGEKSIKGVECAIWTEYIADTERMDEMLYPRLAAVAERGWSRWHADYRSFKTRLGAAYNIFDKYGVGYATMVEVDPGPVRKIASLLKFGKNFLHPSMKESLKRQKLNRKRLKEKYPDGKQ